MAEITNAGTDHPKQTPETEPMPDTSSGRPRRGRVDLSAVAAWEQLVAAGLAPTSALDQFHGEQLTGQTGPDLPVNPAAGLARTALAGGGDRHGATLPTTTLARLACDAHWRRIIIDTHGVPLDIGRATRYATPAQRAALVVRDGGCVVPGCAMPVSWCDVHHHTPWEHGGPTDLDNLYPLCGRHHTEVHAGIWQIEWLNGLPWVRPPRSLYTDQPLLRNTTHHARAEAHHLGQQLALELDHQRTDWLTTLPTTDPPTDPHNDEPPRGLSSSCTVRRRTAGIAAPRAWRRLRT